MLFTILAITALSVFYGCYVVKMICQKRKGITTDQMGKGKHGRVKAIELTVKAASILCLFVEILCIAFGTTMLPVWTRIVGTAVCGIGTALFVTAVITMRDSWRAGVSETEKTQLVTTGIYAVSRNPAFLAFDLVYLGILLTFFHWALFAITLLTIVMFHIQIVKVEEPFLRSAFGTEYEEYQSRVFRYLGRKLFE